ncbi:hypothetical protein [Chelativorans sp. YIM 93263]|uniref:hypothetical protein n=1 Tax=Chelativorans sp. YIM 93263 TaxID=2906648 RepID=UPI00237911D0|nr:hypothetical protein [Chelativorans sp. YIM 93263]
MLRFDAAFATLARADAFVFQSKRREALESPGGTQTWVMLKTSFARKARYFAPSSRGLDHPTREQVVRTQKRRRRGNVSRRQGNARTTIMEMFQKMPFTHEAVLSMQCR